MVQQIVTSTMVFLLTVAAVDLGVAFLMRVRSEVGGAEPRD